MSQTSVVAEKVPGASDRPWYVVSRWQEYQGEVNANLLRVAAISLFYIIEMINYYGVDLGFIQFPRVRDQAFHRTVTALAVAWIMVGVAVHLCLLRQLFPAYLKYVSTGLDLALLTLLLMVADGPRSPLIVGYFLILALACLRLNVRLIQCATVGTCVGYLVLLGYARVVAPDREIRVPRYQQLIVLTALALTGVILGQVIRSVRAIGVEYVRRSTRASSVKEHYEGTDSTL